MNIHITVGNSFYLFVHATGNRFDEVAEKAGAGAGLFANDYRPGSFDDMVQFPVGDSHGAAGNQDAGGIFRGDPLLGRDAFIQFITEGG